MSSKKNIIISDQQCTIHCSFDLHAEAISRAITLHNVSDSAIASYLNLICSNCGCITDMGRTPLHIAASVGRNTLAKWLICKKGASINARDLESGYTPLHRSVLYGQIHVAVTLMQFGGDLSAEDSEGLTPIDIAMKDCARKINPKTSNELYVWGSNCNYTLGTSAQRARNHPEPLEFFRKRGTSLKKVFMEKFHTVFLSTEGEVFSCGHGQGGRLGTDSESSVMIPQPIIFQQHRVPPPGGGKENSSRRNICEDVAVGRDHTLFLMEDGLVYSCGLNDHRQLGIVPPPDKVLTPRPIHPKFFAPEFRPMGICAGRYHSVIWSHDRIYFVGLNAGQLGASGKTEKFFVEPKEDPYFEEKNVKNFVIKSVVASIGATVVLSKANVLTVINRFNHTKIHLCNYLDTVVTGTLSKFREKVFVRSIAVTGGRLESLDPTDGISDKGNPITIAVLLNNGKLGLWQEETNHLRRCTFSLSRSIEINNLVLNTRKLLLVTVDGEVFEGDIHVFKPKPASVTRTGLVETIEVKRIPFIHRAMYAACDPTENNYAVIQKGPVTAAYESINVPKGRMTLNMAKLLEEADESDPLHDVVFQVGSRRFPAHRYVIGRSSEVLLEKILECAAASGDSILGEVPVVQIQDVHPELFWTLLVFMYSNSCSLLVEGPCPAWLSAPAPSCGVLNQVNLPGNESGVKGKSEGVPSLLYEERSIDALGEAREAAIRFGLPALVEKLDEFKVENGNIIRISHSKTRSFPFKWDRLSHSEFHDVRLKSIDGVIFPAHKCILVARLEYFNIMFLRGWRESSSQEDLYLPIQSGVLEILLEFLYTDKIASLNTHGRNERADLAWNLLIAADEFLMARLKVLAEKAIKELLTIQNVVQVLNMAIVYNAEKLIDGCLEFISFNMADMLELRSLEGLSEDLLLKLTKYYRKSMKLMDYRVITPHSDAPTLAEIHSAVEVQPPPWTSPEELENISMDALEKKRRASNARRRARVRKSSENGPSPKSLNDSSFSEGFDESLEKSMLMQSMDEQNSSDIILDLMEHPEPDEPTEILMEKENQKPREESLHPAPFEPKTKLSVPLPHPLFMQKHSTDNAANILDYPELGQGDRNHVRNRQRTKSERSGSHRMTKLSQKERKRQLSLNESSPPKEEMKQSVCPWEKVSMQVNDEREVSLREIMEREAMEARRARQVSSCSIPTPRKKHGSQSAHSWSNIISPGSSPSSAAQAFPKFESGSYPDRQLRLDEIIAEENQRKENFFRMRTKPLHLTQLEDRAIDDLMKFYNAHNSYFECITVKRVEYALMAQPKWIPRPPLSYDNNAK